MARSVAIGATVLGSLLYASRASAVIVSGIDPMPNPDNGYVGNFNGSSCVAVGRNWFVTARHVGGNVGQDVQMRGVNYRVIEIRAHQTFDVQLLRVAETLPGFHKLASNAGLGDPCFLAGYGVTAASTLPNNAGYDWNGQRKETWGANVIEGDGSLLAVRFDKPSDDAAVPHEATFAVNDSGGALFTMGSDGSFELAGIAVSVLGFGSAHWYDTSFSLNVSLYRTWMLPVVDPEVPISSGVMAPRAMVGGPGIIGLVATALLAISLAGIRRRRG